MEFNIDQKTQSLTKIFQRINPTELCDTRANIYLHNCKPSKLSHQNLDDFFFSLYLK